MAKKSETGLEIVIRGFINTDGSIQATNEATSAVLEGTKTGNYQPLLALMKIEDTRAQMKTRRLKDTTPGHVAEVIDIEEQTAA